MSGMLAGASTIGLDILGWIVIIAVIAGIVHAKREAKASGIKIVKVRGNLATTNTIARLETQGYRLENQTRATLGKNVLRFRRTAATPTKAEFRAEHVPGSKEYKARHPER